MKRSSSLFTKQLAFHEEKRDDTSTGIMIGNSSSVYDKVISFTSLWLLT
jgi:hypothetical protein